MGEYEDYLAQTSALRENIKETPRVGLPWCPGCYPDWDQIESLLYVEWCISLHPNPGSIGHDGGPDDKAAISASGEAMYHGSGLVTAGQFDNRQACAVIHGRPALEVPAPAPNKAPEDVYLGDGDCG